MKRNLYILAPNDRFNYGDLLFPYVVSYYLGNNYDKVFFCSTFRSNLSKLGGLRTIGHSSLFYAKSRQLNHLIVAGGESLLVDWTSILYYSSTFIRFVDSLFSKIGRGVSLYHWILNFYCTRLYKTRCKYPFTIGKHELPNFSKVMYNSVGGSYILKDENIRNDKDVRLILSSSDYISVRDQKTLEYLSMMDIKAYLSADSAITISKIFSETFLLERICNESKLLWGKRFVFFECAIHYMPDERKISQELKDFATLNKLDICLRPIGTALGHSDQLKLKRIYKELDKNGVLLIDKPSVWDIMWLIKHASIYIGSSLHGTITAMSYSVPFTTFGPQKLNEYINTWVPDLNIRNLAFCPEEKVFNNANRLLSLNYHYSPEEQISLVETNFSRIRQIIHK